MRLRRPLTALVLAVAVSAIGVGISLAKAPTITLKSEKISALKLTALADAKGRTLYRLKPETSKHLLCTSKLCLSVWVPSTVKSKTTKVKLPKGISGKVTLLHRGKAYQVCVGGLPLYTFIGDKAKGKAVGQHIKSFGGVWGVLKVGSTAKSPVAAPPPPPAY
jgi:predicted lipoprotein with Yx(FWY)xxD motif